MPENAAGVRRRLDVIRIVALLDAALLIVLVIAAVSGAEGLVSVLGPIHGVGFVALLGLTAKGSMDGRWGWWFPIAVLVTGGPLGSIVGELRVRRQLREPVRA